VTRLLLCGVLSLVVSGCLGLCPDGLLTCLLVGGLLESKRVLQCGKWRLFASFGVYGGKGIIRALRIWKVSWRRFYPHFTIRCIFWIMAYVHHLSFSFDDFLARFSRSI